MSDLYLYNTLTRKKELFVPIKKDQVKMYVCGMTVYDYCHLGHARVMVVFDMISRWLKHLNYNLIYVRNITDIDDKIINRSIENKQDIHDLTNKYINAMHEDIRALGVEDPTFEPRATNYIDSMINFISNLIDKGFAYIGDNNDVYYSITKFKQYGQLSGKNINDLISGERVKINEAKNNPLDFVLWKSAKPNEPYWSSPWGNGRPGWHIECSSMGKDLLGDSFDIHGGGSDLQFPHHENEIAQNYGNNLKNLYDKEYYSNIKYWIHNGFIKINGEKMSKSLNNFYTIKDALAEHNSEVIRFFLLKTHYRSPINYTNDKLDEAKSALIRLYNTLQNIIPKKPKYNINDKTNIYTSRFYAAMNDDFNTAEAIAVLFDLVTDINKNKNHELSYILKFLGNILGILKQDPLIFLQQDNNKKISENITIDEIEKLILKRSQARKEKNWQESDRIRDLLLKNDILLEDKVGITTWRRK